jgi:hypothetical protein
VGDVWRGKRNSISEKRPTLASPRTLIVASVPRNQRCSPSPGLSTKTRANHCPIHLRSRKGARGYEAPCPCLAYDVSHARVLAINDLAKTRASGCTVIVFPETARHAPRCRLTRYLEEGWTLVIESDVDGPNALPRQLTSEQPSLMRFSAMRRARVVTERAPRRVLLTPREALDRRPQRDLSRHRCGMPPSP